MHGTPASLGAKEWCAVLACALRGLLSLGQGVAPINLPRLLLPHSVWPAGP